MMATISQQAYGEFLTQVKADRVKKVTINPNRIEYIVATKTGKETYFTTPDSQSEDLPELLRSHGVEYTVPNPHADNLLGTLLGIVLPSLVAVGAGALLLKYTEDGNGVMGVGKSKARVKLGYHSLVCPVRNLSNCMSVLGHRGYGIYLPKPSVKHPVSSLSTS
jgi:ATP-dependent Zn protease